MSTITLRAATLDDANTVLNVIHAAFEPYRGVLNPPSGAHKETQETIAQKIETGGGFIATLDDIVAGVVVYQPEETRLYLGRLAVLPEYRGKGIAHVLIAAVEELARQHGFPGVRLGVRVQLPQNRAFFERLGYQVTEYESHPGFTEYTFMNMEKMFDFR